MSAVVLKCQEDALLSTALPSLAITIFLPLPYITLPEHLGEGMMSMYHLESVILCSLTGCGSLC